MRELLLALIAFLLPLTLYAYLPIRYAADPPLNVVGDYFTIPLTTPSGLWWMITGGMFRQAMFSAGVVNIGRLAGALWLDLLGVGLLLALIGALRLPQRAFTAFLVMGSISVVVFFGLYDVIDTRTMIIPALVGLIPLVAVGLHEIEQHVGQRIVWGAGAVVIGVGVMVTWGYADRSGDTLAYAFAAEVMQTAEPDALLIAQWTGATPLTYMQVVEGRRPDVTVFDRGLFALGLRDTLVRQGITAEERIDALTLAAYYAVVEEALAAGRPVYVMEEDLVLLQRYCLEPVGVMYRVRRCDWY